MTETEYTVRVVLKINVHDDDPRNAITSALELVNSDVWRTLEAEGFEIEADAVSADHPCWQQ